MSGTYWWECVRSSINSTVQSCFSLQIRILLTEICLHNMKALLGEYAHAFNADYHQWQSLTYCRMLKFVSSLNLVKFNSLPNYPLIYTILAVWSVSSGTSCANTLSLHLYPGRTWDSWKAGTCGAHWRSTTFAHHHIWVIRIAQLQLSCFQQKASKCSHSNITLRRSL